MKPGKTSNETAPIYPGEETNEEPQSINDLVESGFEAISKALEEMEDGEGWIYLHRRPPDGDDYQAIPQRIKVENFDIRKVAKKFGGGDYRARFVRSNGKYFGQRSFVIDHRIKGDLDGPGESSRNNDNVESLRTAFEFIERFQRNAPRPPEPKDNSEILIAMIQSQAQQTTALLQGLFQVMASRNGEGGLGVKDLIGLLKPPDPMENLKLLKELNNLHDRNEPEDKGEDMIQSIVKAGLGVIGKLGAPHAAPHADEPSANPPAQAGELNARVQKFVTRCAKAAAQNRDPYPYYDQLIEACGQAEQEQIKAYLRRPEWFAELFPDQTGNAGLRAWFGDLRLLILHNGDESMLDSEHDFEPPDGAAGVGDGEQGDARHNAKPDRAPAPSD